MGNCPLFYFKVKMFDVQARAEELIKGVVEEAGLELIHVEYEPRGASPILRIYIDKEGGVDISDCTEISRRVSVLLDVEDFIPTSYLLEVSSPGVERPLFKEGDYRRFQGKEIRLEATEKIENRRNFTGFIEDFSDGILKLQCDDRMYEIPYRLIKRAHLVYRFD